MMGRPRQQSSAICWLHSKPSCVFPCAHRKLVKDSWEEKVLCSTECEWTMQLHVTYSMDGSGTEVESSKQVTEGHMYSDSIYMKTKQTRRNNIWFIDHWSMIKLYRIWDVGSLWVEERGPLRKDICEAKGTSNAWFLRLKCSLFTQAGLLEEFYLYSQVSEGEKAKFFIDTWCLVLPWGLILLLDSWWCRGQSKTEPCLGPLLLLG